MDSESKSMFVWRKGRSVPGKASSSPKREVTKEAQSKMRRNGQAPATSYQDFQESVNDAWDLGDDEFCVVSDVKISKRMAQSTAMSVIRNHQNRNMDFSEPPSREMCSSNNPDVRSVRQFPGHAQLFVASSTRKTAEDQQSGRLEKFQAILDGPNANLEELRLQSWHGIPPTLRAVTWRLLCGYVPTSAEKRETTLKRKREEYWNFVEQYYGTRHDDSHQETFRQIHIDIPRMSPLIALFQQIIVQEIFERILYIWAIRHPASGYVQGINDLVTPFFIVFLQELVAEDVNLDHYDVSSLATEDLHNVEADSFWCLSKLLDGIQDNYTFAQPGIQNKVRQLKELVQRVDVGLHQHLISHEVDYLQFSFRWMNNLLMRELPLHCTIRLWDTCLAETHGFASFHLYICAAFLLHWRSYLLRERDFQGLMMLLQNLPTQSWGDEEIGQLVAEAYKMHYLFSSAPNHLQATLK